MRHALRFAVCLCFVSIALGGCGGSGVDWSSYATPPGVTWVPGTPVEVASATLDASGGTITVPDGGPLAGVTVTVPVGALGAPTTITISADEGGSFTNAPAGEQPVVIRITSDGQTAFETPLRVEFPFPDPTRYPVAYWIRDEDRTLEVVRQLPIDRAAGRGGFLTYHLSPFGYFDPPDPNTSYADRTNYPYFTGFLPKVDGFAFSNRTPIEYAPIGRCEGMAMFAKWFKEQQGGGLFSRFTEKVPTKTMTNEAVGPSLTAQEVIATRAHLAAHVVDPGPATTDPETGTAIELNQNLITVFHAIANTGKPVMIGFTKAGAAAGHVVLAIGYDDQRIGMYDPNYPGMTKEIVYSFGPDGQGKMKYSNWDYFGVWGNGEVPPTREPYSKILEDAEAGFHDENMTKIEITSPADSKVTGPDVLLEGKVYSGAVAISELAARVLYPDTTFSDPQTVTLAPGQQEFSLPLKVQPGDNYVLFEAQGMIVGKVMRVIPNDKDFNMPLEDWQMLSWKDSARPDSQLSISYTSTLTRGDETTITTVDLTAPFVYYEDPQLPSLLAQPTWYFDCSTDINMCPTLIEGQTVDSLPFLDASNLPVQVNTYREETYRNGALTDTWETPFPTVTCERIMFWINLEPGSAPGNVRYRPIFVVGGNINCPNMQNQLPGIPRSLEVEGMPTCESPPTIQPGTIDSWIENPQGAKTLSLGATASCGDGSYTLSEDVSVVITLAPCATGPCLWQ